VAPTTVGARWLAPFVWLLGLPAGSMAHFELAAGKVAARVAHRSVEEVWFVLSGRGEMWRKQGEREQIVALEPGVCVTIPLGHRQFQFRAAASEALAAVAITMPPWPGDAEAVAVAWPWAASDVRTGIRRVERP